MRLPQDQLNTLTNRMAWLPNLAPGDVSTALTGLPHFEESTTFADQQRFCRFATFIGKAMADIEDISEHVENPMATPVMILTMKSSDGELFQIPEETTSQLTRWIGACLSICNNRQATISGIGLRLSKTLHGAAFAYAGDTVWQIAGDIPADNLPEVPVHHDA